MDLSGSPKRRRGQQLEDALLTAAFDQLMEFGYGAFTIDAVADRASTSRTVIYRRWPDRQSLALAALKFGLTRDPVEVPDTGTLRGDLIAILTLFNESRSALVPTVSVQLAGYYAETGTTFSELRAQVIGNEGGSVMDAIFDRAVARGEIDPARLTPRVRTLPVDLFRHEMLMTMRPASDETLIIVIDDVILPLLTRPVGDEMKR